MVNIYPDYLKKREKSSYLWRDNTTDPTDIKIKYYEQLYVNTFVNLEEMGKFLERYKIPKLTQEEMYNTDGPVSQFGEN